VSVHHDRRIDERTVGRRRLQGRSRNRAGCKVSAGRRESHSAYRPALVERPNDQKTVARRRAARGDDLACG
jgi:hypothetical protein